MYRISLLTVITAVANLFCLLSIFSTWLYVLSPPTGYPPRSELVANANLLYVAEDPAYRILLAIPFALISGSPLTILSLKARQDTTHRLLLAALAVTSLMLIAVSNFVFGSIFEQRKSFAPNNETSFSVSLGPATRLASAASVFYFIALIALIVSG